eukprot:CAMPEP_0183370698 /NCGR_PEP_ID=MMETSP0164_2-20130417/103214_1 /TAXON_ID=221442 /ORGANISM="Coccolithus pelagicus ssp braarudi, Strain PLY182g" /LENGTH=129 /DNA_ID=CAMNT_0025547147 /DNA_START=11 /DNA_END=397 /DNA_ORIENTATION=+
MDGVSHLGSRSATPPSAKASSPWQRALGGLKREVEGMRAATAEQLQQQERAVGIGLKEYRARGTPSKGAGVSRGLNMAADWAGTPMQGPAQAGELLAFYKETAERLQIELGRSRGPRSTAEAETTADTR